MVRSNPGHGEEQQAVRAGLQSCTVVLSIKHDHVCALYVLHHLKDIWFVNSAHVQGHLRLGEFITHSYTIGKLLFAEWHLSCGV